MRRFLVLALVLIAGILGGTFVGFRLWGRDAAQLPTLEQRLHAAEQKGETLTQERSELERRLDLVTKEQERLAQANEILRQQRTEEQLTGESAGSAPAALPPK